MPNNNQAKPEPKFPRPVYFSRYRHWKLSELVNYERALVGLPAAPPAPPESEIFLTAAHVRARYGGVSDMWLWRRVAEHSEQEAA
jgi:hypothetical protein